MRCVICAYKGGAAYRDTAGLSPIRTFGADTAQFRDCGACRLCADLLGRDKPGIAQCYTALPRYRDAVQDRAAVKQGGRGAASGTAAGFAGIYSHFTSPLLYTASMRIFLLYADKKSLLPATITAVLRQSARQGSSHITVTEARRLFSGIPETNCQGLFNQIHKKATKKCQKQILAPDTFADGLFAPA